MEAYKASLKGENATLMVEPDSAFFDYLRSPTARAREPAPAAPAAPERAGAEHARGAGLIDDLLLGLGLVAIVEGLVLALAPRSCARRWS